jgi:hypothetical protein
MPLGAGCRLLSRPFRGRPSPDAWNELVDRTEGLLRAGDLDLLVVDPLASFLPGHSDSDAGTLMTMLQPLQRLASAGAAVMLLHHPRKKVADEGSTARGSGALLGYVDVILELHRFGRLQSDNCRRRLIALSRHPETPANLYYEWDAKTGQFRDLDEPLARQFGDNWSTIESILKGRRQSATHLELLMDWPAGLEKPSPAVLYRWLNLAFEQKRVRRSGAGVRNDPYCYRLPDKDDEYYDRGELPPPPMDLPLVFRRE